MTKSIRVVHLTTHDYSGAGRAAARLHRGLLAQGCDSLFYVANGTTDEPRLVQPTGLLGYYKRPINRILVESQNKGLVNPHTAFSRDLLPSFMVKAIRELQADVIHLHWIGWDFLQIDDLKNFQTPLVWTLHDSWAYTGGCHITYDCKRYEESCGTCPQLKDSSPHDLSHTIWQRKSKLWRDLDLRIVTPSRWLAECAKSSSLLREISVQVIPNGLDPTQFKPIDKLVARDILNLPRDKKLVLFGAMNSTGDRRKGFHLLQPALLNLSQSQDCPDIEVVIFGASKPENAPDFGFPVHYVGTLHDDVSLSVLYAACDVFVAPSIMDNLPNTVLEAIACGRPCVAFNIGGMPDMISHQANGYLATPFEIDDLAHGIAWVLENETRWHSLAEQSRRNFESRFLLADQASAYHAIYENLLTR